MDKPRTSWECIRLDAVRTHLVKDDDKVELPFEDDDSSSENCVTFWSIPDAYTVVPSYMELVNEQ